MNLCFIKSFVLRVQMHGQTKEMNAIVQGLKEIKIVTTKKIIKFLRSFKIVQENSKINER